MLVWMDMLAMGCVVCLVMDVRISMRQRRFMMMSVEQDDRRVSELRVDMGVVAARMCVVERANLGKPEREQKCPEQGNHKSPGPYPLFSEDSHVTILLLPPKRFFSLSLGP